MVFLDSTSSTRWFCAVAYRRTAASLLALGLGGLPSCMDDDGVDHDGADRERDAGEDLICTLELAVDGASDRSTSSADLVACLDSGSGEGSAHLSFAIWPEGRSPWWAFIIDLQEIEAGALGEHPAFVRVVPRGDSVWETDGCLVNVTAYEPFERDRSADRWYRVAGRGHCSEPALPHGGEGDGEIHVGSFEFEATVPWRD
jgi:hypothetical protein